MACITQQTNRTKTSNQKTSIQCHHQKEWDNEQDQGRFNTRDTPTSVQQQLQSSWKKPTILKQCIWWFARRMIAGKRHMTQEPRRNTLLPTSSCRPMCVPLSTSPLQVWWAQNFRSRSALLSPEKYKIDGAFNESGPYQNGANEKSMLTARQSLVSISVSNKIGRRKRTTAW